MTDNNMELLKNAFSNALEIEESMINNELKYQSVPQWDSITHMILISELENTFQIEINGDDILEMNSFENIKTILGNYNISFK